DLVGRTEEIVGKWLKGKREQIVLATKCWGAMGRGANEHGLSRKHILTAVEGSLRRLQTDYLDLYQAHAPDFETPLDETLRAFDLRCGLPGRTQAIYRKRYWEEAQFAAVARLQDFFAARNKSLTQVAIAWVLAQPGVTAPIVGATSPEQLRQSLPATELTLD